MLCWREFVLECVCVCKSCHQTEKPSGNGEIMDYAKLFNADDALAVAVAPSTY